MGENERPLVLAHKELGKYTCKVFQMRDIMQLVVLFLDVKDYTSFCILKPATAKTLEQYVKFHRLDLSQGIIPQLKSKDEKLQNGIWSTELESLMSYSSHVVHKEKRKYMSLYATMVNFFIFGLMFGIPGCLRTEGILRRFWQGFLLYFLVCQLIISIRHLRNLYLFRNVTGTIKFPGFIPENISIEFCIDFTTPESILKTIAAFAAKFDAVYSFRMANEFFFFKRIEFRSDEMFVDYQSQTSPSNKVRALYNINIPDATFTLNYVKIYHNYRNTIFTDFQHIPDFHEPSRVEICVRKI